jgi:hypothetical protein
MDQESMTRKIAQFAALFVALAALFDSTAAVALKVDANAVPDSEVAGSSEDQAAALFKIVSQQRNFQTSKDETNVEEQRR